MALVAPFAPLAADISTLVLATAGSVGTAIELTGLGLLGGYGGALLMRRRGLCWTWAAAGSAPALAAWSLAGTDAIWMPVALITATRLGARWHRADVDAGGDLAELARASFGLRDGMAAVSARRALSHREWFTTQGLLVGHDEQHAAVRVPLGDERGGSHLLVVGATGSGKTVTETWIATRAIGQGMGTVFVDPKGDPSLHRHLRAGAERQGRAFFEWSPQGPGVYNPFGRGSATEIADRVLAAERFTEPHYMRQAQRYLGHVVRALHAAGEPVTLASLVSHMDPDQLEVLARRLDEEQGGAAFAYLDSLTTRQRNELSGTRDRMAIVAESEAGVWLDPSASGAPALDLLDAIRERAVMLFTLDADRRPLLAQMLGAAVVQDLVTATAALQQEPVPTLVVIDEFSAVAAEHVAGLFGRARSAGISVLLGTQELADLSLPGRDSLLQQVLGNVSTLIAHRQSVPESAELIARMAGSRGGWRTAERDDGGYTRTRERTWALHPDRIKSLPVGCAAVLVPMGPNPIRITRMLSVSD